MTINNASLLDQTADAGTMGSYGDRFLVGEHVVAIDRCTMEPKYYKADEDTITMYGVDMIVLQSTTMKPGSRVSEPFFIGRPAKKAETPKKKLNGFGRAVLESLGVVQDTAKDSDGKQFNTAVSKQLKILCEMNASTGTSITSGRQFPGRGLALKVVAKETYSEKAKKSFVNTSYSPVAQTRDDIKAKRAALEAAPKLDAAPVQAAAQSAAAADDMLDGIDC